jgi:hypothetical protein
MNPSLLDPNNHVPEVSEGDGWDDSEAFSDVPTAALPPRRAAAKPPAEQLEVVLRIDPAAPGEMPDATPHRLEVREFQPEVIRLDRTEPVPEKVPRQAASPQLPASDSSPHAASGESREWGRVQRRPLRWLVAAGFGVAVAVIGVLALLPKINATNPPRQSAAVVPPHAPEAEPVMDSSLFLRQAEGRRLYERYLRAATVDEVVPLVRNGPALREILRENWRPAILPVGWEVDAAAAWTVFQEDGSPDFAALSGELPDFSPFLAYFVAEADGSLVLDWEATTGHGTADFAELAAGTGDASKIRGTISLSDFYTADWPEAECQSYRLVSPDGKGRIWCFARRGSAAEAGISRPLTGGAILPEADAARAVIVRLARGGVGTRPDQGLVAEWLHLGPVAP